MTVNYIVLFRFTFQMKRTWVKIILGVGLNFSFPGCGGKCFLSWGHEYMQLVPKILSHKTFYHSVKVKFVY